VNVRQFRANSAKLPVKRAITKVDAIRQFGVLLVLIRSSLIKILKLADVLEEVQHVSKTLFLTQMEAFILSCSVTLA